MGHCCKDVTAALSSIFVSCQIGYNLNYQILAAEKSSTTTTTFQDGGSQDVPSYGSPSSSGCYGECSARSISHLHSHFPEFGSVFQLYKSCFPCKPIVCCIRYC